MVYGLTTPFDSKKYCTISICALCLYFSLSVFFYMLGAKCHSLIHTQNPHYIPLSREEAKFRILYESLKMS